jgi:hypothetical protein
MIAVTVGCVVWQLSFGQNTSPLHQYMNIHSMVSEPAVFRDLQNNIKTIYGDVKPGVQLTYFEDKLLQFKRKLLERKFLPTLELQQERSVDVRWAPDSLVNLLRNAGFNGDPAKMSLTKSVADTDLVRFKPFSKLHEQVERCLSKPSISGKIIQWKIPDQGDRRAIETYILKHCTEADSVLSDSATHADPSISGFNSVWETLRPVIAYHLPYLILHWVGKDFPVDIGGFISLNEILRKLEDNIAHTGKSRIDELINKAGIDKEKDAVLSAVIAVFQANGIGGEGIGDEESKDYSLAITKRIVAYAVQKIRYNIESNEVAVQLYRQLGSERDSLKSDGSLEAFVGAFNKYSAAAEDKLKEEIEKGFNGAEQKVKDVISSKVESLFGASAGFSITKGEGAFDGGLYYGFRFNDSWRGGLYFNGQFNKTDTTQPTQTLVGMQLQFLINQAQADVMFAGRFYNKMGWSSGTWEVGLGLSSRMKNGLIVGLEAFYFRDVITEDVWIAGLSVKGTQKGAPCFLVGFAVRKDGLAPIIQTSFPILGN